MKGSTDISVFIDFPQSGFFFVNSREYQSAVGLFILRMAFICFCKSTLRLYVIMARFEKKHQESLALV